MKCKYEINRDINGSINIFHKNRDYILKKRRKAFGTIQKIYLKIVKETI